MTRALFNIDVDRRSAVEIVIDTVKRLLIEEKLKPGDLLPTEAQLSQSLGVGRGSVREAIKILSAFGITEIRRGTGTYIAGSVSKNVFDPLLFNLLIANGDKSEIIELRRLVEIGIVELIIKNAPDEDIRKLEDQYHNLEEMIESGTAEIEELSKSDLEFHYTMAAITGNQLVNNIYRFIAEIFAPTMHGEYALEPHRMILEALLRRDLNHAIEAIEKHTEVWRRLMERDSGNEE